MQLSPTMIFVLGTAQVPDDDGSFLTLAHFYSPTCLHCVHASASVREAAAQLLRHRVQVLAINCLREESRELCHKFDISHLPDTRVLRYAHLNRNDEVLIPADAQRGMLQGTASTTG